MKARNLLFMGLFGFGVMIGAISSFSSCAMVDLPPGTNYVTSGGTSSATSSSGGGGGTVFGIFTSVYTETYQYDQDNSVAKPYGGKEGYWGTASIGVNDTADKPAVTGCTKSAVLTIGSGGVFWLFCSNQGGSPWMPTEVNLSAYTNGHLHFWIKAPGDALIKLESSKAGNSAPGSGVQTALTYLSTIGVTYNTWFEVSVPMSTFIGLGLQMNLMDVAFGIHNGTGGVYKIAELYYTTN